MRFPFSSDPARDDVRSLASEFEALREADSERLRRYVDYRQENEKARTQAVQGGVETSDYGQRKHGEVPIPRHNVPLPLGMALTVKHAYRISGRLPDAIVDQREETPEEKYRSETMEKIWWGILHESGGDTLIATGAWDGSQLGSACFEVYWDVDKQMPKVCALDPAGVMVVRGLDDPHDFQRVYRFWVVPVETARAEYRGSTFGEGVPAPVDEIVSSHKFGLQDAVMIAECCDKERTVRFTVGVDEHQVVPLYEVKHGLGFTPRIVIPNIGPERDIWGWADYEFVRGLIDYLPQLVSREADILRMVANGAYYDPGSGQDANTVKRILASGGVLPGRPDGKPEPIEAPEVPAFAQGHGDRMMELFKMLGFAPDAAWGGSDTRSGSDRALQLQPMIELTAMKQTNWSSGLSRVAKACYRMIEKKQLTSATYRGSRPGTTPSQRQAFVPFRIGPREENLQREVQRPDGAGGVIDDVAILPRNAKELFGGDYGIRFVWQNRIDPDDPAFVLSELNKFAQGAQSLETTLDRLGFQAPEDEMKRIEAEAERFPWLRQGLVALTMAAIRQNAQGTGGGAPTDVAGGLMSAVDTATSPDGSAMNFDAGTGALPGGLGKLYGGA